MTPSEFSNQFDVLYNNITSNQAPGLNEYEKSVFLTKAQDEIVKNYFNPTSNSKQQGFDDTAKRQMDFANIMQTIELKYAEDGNISHFDSRSLMYELPNDIFVVINENIKLLKVISINIPSVGVETSPLNVIVGPVVQPITDVTEGNDDNEVPWIVVSELGERQVIALDYGEYTRLMSKPYKYPLKYQAWRLLTNGINNKNYAEIVLPYIENLDTTSIYKTNKWDTTDTQATVNKVIPVYNLRYIRRPHPIRLVDFSNSYGEDITIGGDAGISGCELGEGVHEEILQRAVELAKIAWAGDAANVMQAGQRSE